MCRSKFWTTPPTISTMAPMMESGNRIRMTPRMRSDPKLPSSDVVAAGQCAHERHRHRHTHRRRDEVLHGQTGHLHQVALGRLPRIGPAVGVGDKADQRWFHASAGSSRCPVVEMQWQLALHQLENEQETAG